MLFRPIDPNGCHHCGELERSHGARWSAVAGVHHYVAPTDGQRLHRRGGQLFATYVTCGLTQHRMPDLSDLADGHGAL